ncbi:FAD-dependent 5-carboxymethylaminomethyl-2-thiouridine(34) oxidoreductase MnmC [Psychrobacter sp. I-STPA6b]|uniref:FAD-dependent 5-carboxymethylaminomethyl-2-thiouridine(34) oxidoreductase MnmC n=1 Tax=Psychrobacter sp. I-STPA6b TaxID=2585718 RepID=UPI0029CAADD3|nr:FAD-dependent 5-carboxymethylaminomethyl-2-thiouridine(34) oxidoreductase MnmC [Psychrobacter sp. I-STPA6b]
MTTAPITPARLEWREDDMGNVVPVSIDFADVYYSLSDGLNESRYVFVQQNHLPERFLSHLTAPAYSNNPTFSIAELGFGTGLNLLATWQLWRQLKQQQQTDKRPQPRLHFISFEKYPLSHADLKRALQCWQEKDPSLSSLIEQLLTLYPTLVAGCHRLHLEDDVTLDLWLGDASDNLAKLNNDNGAYIDAWFLDGFAPSCNESLWAEQIFSQIQRLSAYSTTVATFSCAGVVKRGLKDIGFSIQKVKGFGRKREMLTATLTNNQLNHLDNHSEKSCNSENNHKNGNTTNNLAKLLQKTQPRQLHHVSIIGAGIAGLSTAWALANRGIKVTILEQNAPLSGASGNPRALLAPKMTPIHHIAEHLHSMGYLYSQRYYQQLNSKNPEKTSVFEATATLDLLLKANVDTQQIADYPDGMATTLSEDDAKKYTGLQQQPLLDNLYLPQAGLVNPMALANIILAHPLITLKPYQVQEIQPYQEGLLLHCINTNTQSQQKTQQQESSQSSTDAVIISAGNHSHLLDKRIFKCRLIRGQLSWLTPSTEQLAQLPKLPLKYGGYCALFDAQPIDAHNNTVMVGKPQFLFGASFVRNDTSIDSRENEQLSNRQKLVTAIPALEKVISNDSRDWQSRVGIRAQTPDYHPILGQLDTQGKVWTLCGMGSKGFAFSPLCAQALADQMTGSFAPLSRDMLARLSPHRARLQTPLAE